MNRLNPIASLFLAVFSCSVFAGPSPAPLDFDPTFAGDGTLILEPGTRALAYAGLIDEGGEIVLFGESDNGNASFREAIFQRIGANGTPGAPGRFDAASFGCSVPRAFLTGIRLSNGDYLGGGYVQEGCSGRPRYFNALQLTPAGGQVEEFDRVQFNNQRAYIYALGEQSGGGIVAAGFAEGNALGSETFDIAVARYSAPGTLDATFGTGGTFTFDLANDADWTNDLVIDADDRILVAGYTTSAGGGRDMTILRLTPDGALDTSFNGSGVVRYDGAGFDDNGVSIDLAPGGRILIGGNRFVAENQRAATVLALNDDGSVDTSFATNGVATVDLGNTDATITDIHYDAGRIYVTGWSRPVGGDLVELDAAVTVLDSNGTPNSFFNGGQPRVFAFDPALGPQSDQPQSIDVSDDGEQIVVTGFTDNQSRTVQRFGVARFIGLENALFADGFETQ